MALCIEQHRNDLVFSWHLRNQFQSDRGPYAFLHKRELSKEKAIRSTQHYYLGSNTFVASI